MRYAALLIVAALATPAAAQDSFATRSDCLQVLQQALSWAQHADRVPEFEAIRLAEAPPAAREHAEAALDAIKRRSQALVDYADAVLLICQSYE